MFTRETPLSRVAQQERKSEIFGHGRKAKPAPRRGKVLLARLIFFVIFFMFSLALGIQRGIWSFNECIGSVNPYLERVDRY